MTLLKPGQKILYLVVIIILGYAYSGMCQTSPSWWIYTTLSWFSNPLSPKMIKGWSQAGHSASDLALIAQSGPDQQPPINSGYSLSIQVKLVNLFVTVVDRKGRVVKDLQQKDFKIWEDDKKQTITHFATHKDANLSVAILLDVSGSMGIMNKFENSGLVIRELAQHLKHKDEMALFTFADGIVNIVVPFTQNKHKVTLKLKKLTPYGKTALYWAIDIMPRIIGKPKNRQAILLLTDGIDNLSKITLKQMLDNARHTRIPIYTLNFTKHSTQYVRPPEEYARISVLRTVADHTGGSYFEVAGKDDVYQALEKITTELRYQYLLGYRSNQKPEPGSYHKLRLQTHKKKYIVRVRKGYYVSKK